MTGYLKSLIFLVFPVKKFLTSASAMQVNRKLTKVTVVWLTWAGVIKLKVMLLILTIPARSAHTAP